MATRRLLRLLSGLVMAAKALARVHHLGPRPNTKHSQRLRPKLLLMRLPSLSADTGNKMVLAFWPPLVQLPKSCPC